MSRCEATTKSGKRCLNHALANGDYCRVHEDQCSGGSVAAATLGALIGHALLPGLGGALLGGASGALARRIYKENQVSKKKVFVSFDFDNDRVLKDFILGQARHADSPFEVVDHSLKEAAPERDWPTKARAAIKRSDLVLVMVGRQTHRAQGVLREVTMAREEGTPIVQVIGYKDGEYTAVPNAGRLYAWNWDNLKRLLA
jgi:hypothetical protein